jgi:hypothetical protein
LGVLPRSGAVIMHARDPAEAVEVLNLLLKFFGDGERWIKGRFSDRRGNCCLVGALDFVSGHHAIKGDAAERYLAAAISDERGRRIRCDLTGSRSASESVSRGSLSWWVKNSGFPPGLRSRRSRQRPVGGPPTWLRHCYSGMRRQVNFAANGTGPSAAKSSRCIKVISVWVRPARSARAESEASLPSRKSPPVT